MKGDNTIMKRITKFICIGLGAAAVGFITYELLKKDEQTSCIYSKKDSSTGNDSNKNDDHTKEIIERRRQRIAKKIKEQKAAKSEMESANNDSGQTKSKTEIDYNTKSK